MAIHIQKKQTVDSQFKMVKLQLILHAFFKGLDLAESYMDCATLLAINGFNKDFFKTVVETGIFKSEQAARNCMSRLKAADIIVKSGKDWIINPQISIGIDNIILLELKVANLQ